MAALDPWMWQMWSRLLADGNNYKQWMECFSTAALRNVHHCPLSSEQIGGDRCFSRRNPRAEGYFSFLKSNQTWSVPILTPVKMPSSWGLNTGHFWATAGTKVPKDVGWRANGEANWRVKETCVKIFEGGRAGRCLADEFKSFWRELGVNQMPAVREELVVVRRWRPKSRGFFWRRHSQSGNRKESKYQLKGWRGGRLCGCCSCWDVCCNKATGKKWKCHNGRTTDKQTERHQNNIYTHSITALLCLH